MREGKRRGRGSDAGGEERGRRSALSLRNGRRFRYAAPQNSFLFAFARLCPSFFLSATSRLGALPWKSLLVA